MESKYLERFKKVVKANQLNGLASDRVIVEVLPKEELKTSGGIILATKANDHRSMTEENRPTLAVVLAAGEDVKLEPGNVVLVSALGLKCYSNFPGLQEYVANSIAMTMEHEVHVAWRDLEAYASYRELINS